MATGQNDVVDLVLDFCNTIDVEDGTDELATAETYGAWLAAHDSGEPGRSPSPTELAAAVELRTALRGCIARACGIDPHEEPDSRGVSSHGALADVDIPVGIRIATDGSGIRLETPDPLTRVAGAAARLAMDGRFERMKMCPADDCRWVFYDRSRNGSRQWCSMQVCGNRAKVRASRARARTTHGSR